MGEHADDCINAGLDQMLDDSFDEAYFEEHDFGRKRVNTVTCKYCGEGGLYWIQTEKGWRLYEKYGSDIEPHICQEYGKEKGVLMNPKPEPKKSKFRVGDIVVCVNRSTSTTAVEGKEYEVLKLQPPDGFFTKESGVGWYYEKNFELVCRKEPEVGDDCPECEVCIIRLDCNCSTTNPPCSNCENNRVYCPRCGWKNEEEGDAIEMAEHEFEIEDISFETLMSYRKKQVLKGYVWQCGDEDCESMFKKQSSAARCCKSPTIRYIEMPDCYYYSESKDKIVLIADMMAVHLTNAIKKLRLTPQGAFYHLLPALEAEASRRNMAIMDGE